VTEEYRIPTRRVRVELLLAGRGTIRADLYLLEHGERAIGPERPQDLLNGTKRFLPVEHPERGTVLVRRRSVLMASLAADDALENDPGARELLAEARIEETHAREVPVEVRLEDGTEISGTVAYVRPRGEQRLQDYLNSTETFFRVWDEGAMHLVNGERAVSIRARRE